MRKAVVTGLLFLVASSVHADAESADLTRTSTKASCLLAMEF
jgi:hypothetical protein